MLFSSRRLLCGIALLLASCVIMHAQSSIVDASQLLQEEKYEQALSVCDSLIAHNPQDDAAYYIKGMSCMRLGRDVEAEISLLMAIELDGGNKWYYEPLFDYYYYGATVLGRSSASLEELAIKMVERFPSYYGNLPIMQFIVAEAYRHKGNHLAFFSNISKAVASEELSAATKANYLDSILKLIDAKTYRVWHKQFDDVVNLCVSTHPSDSSVLRMAGVWCYGTGRADAGKAYFHAWQTAWPQSAEPHKVLLEIALLEDDLDTFVKEAEIIMSLEPSSRAAILCSIADQYHAHSRKALAEQYYKKALKADSHQPMVLNNYAYMLSTENRQLRRAERMAKEAVRQDPDNASYLDTLAWIMHLRGKDMEAQALFKQALVHGGRDKADVLEHYAAVLEALGDSSRAIYYRNLAKSCKK